MVIIRKYFMPAFLLVLILLLVKDTAFSQENSTVIGIITEDSQLVTDEGDVYDIARNEKADELIKNVKMRVEVKGIVKTDQDTGSRYIIVSSFKLLVE